MWCRDHPSLWAFLFMAMNNEIKNKIRERYLQCDSKFFDKFVEQNQDVKQELELILSINPWFETIRNVYVAWNHGIYDTVKCKYCGKPLKVENAIYGKHFYCSKKCADADPRTSELRKKTCLEKYGTSTPLLNEECKKKTVATCREKFGNDMFAGSDEYKRRVPSPFGKKEVQDKSRQTKIERHGEDFGKVIFEEKVKDSMIKRNMERYGVPYVLMNKEKADETHRTMKERYGDEYFWRTSSNNDIKMDIGFSRIGNWSDYVIPLFSREQYEGREKEYSWRCVRCGHEFIQRIYTTGLGKDRMVPRCEKCFPKSTCSIAEKEVLDFVKSIYNGRIIENNQTVLGNRLELDIYIPDKKVAIEFDGLYWHSEENGKDASYHLNKTVECEKNGIRLIHIFEDEWNEKREIVKDRIKSILGVGQKRIFARKCSIMHLDSKTANDIKNIGGLLDNVGAIIASYYSGNYAGMVAGAAGIVESIVNIFDSGLNNAINRIEKRLSNISGLRKTLQTKIEHELGYGVATIRNALNKSESDFMTWWYSVNGMDYLIDQSKQSFNERFGIDQMFNNWELDILTNKQLRSPVHCLWPKIPYLKVHT